MKYSFIIPVFNRPDELNELLNSLLYQNTSDFEVIVVEDEYEILSADIVKKYENKLQINYFFKENSGPGQSRNYGVARSQGEYIIILDSDTTLPPDYLSEVDKELLKNPCDAFGGPNRSHPSFTITQKAISYAMTSFFTTGGIRGGKNQLDKFYPRSFNMGVKREVYEKLHGFSAMRFGEDIDFSIRIIKEGYSCRLFPQAWLWHKRRTDLRKFFKQVYNSGIARINLAKRHPGSLKLVHLLPSFFTLGLFVLLCMFVVGLLLTITTVAPSGHYVTEEHAIYFSSNCTGLAVMKISLALPLLFSLLIFVDASIKEKSIIVGAKAVAASFIQLLGYGSGFLVAFWQRIILKRDEFEAFKKNFYK